ncbi:MAG: rhomboid family intramembrane serine protease [Pseudomonadota bacterium]
MSTSAPLPRFPIIATALLIIASVFVFLWQFSNGASAVSPEPADLLEHGGNLALLTLIDQPWRLYTSLFVHAGIVHLLANMAMLAAMGVQAGRHFKVEGLLAIFMCGGVAASFVSAWWAAHHMVSSVSRYTPFGFVDTPQINLIVSAGASGAIMALCGALAVLALQQALDARTLEPEEQVSGKGLLQVIALNIGLGFFVGGIDQAAHIGGLLAGAAMGLGIGGAASQRRVAHLLRIALSSGLILAAVWWALPSGVTPELENARSEWDKERGVDRQKKEAVESEAKAERAAAQEALQLPEPVGFEQAKGRVLPVGKSSVAMALSGDEQQVVVADRALNQVTVIDVATGRVLRTVKGPPVPPAPKSRAAHDFMGSACRPPICGRGVAGVVLLGEGPPEQALVTAMTSSRSVSQVDLRTGAVVRSMEVGQAPQAIIVSPDRSRAWVHSTIDRSISVIDLQSWTVLKTWPLKTSIRSPVDLPLPMWFSADGTQVFVHSVDDMQVETYDASTLEQLDYEIPSTRIYRAMPHPTSPDRLLALSRFEVLEMDIQNLYAKAIWSFCESQRGVDFTAVRDSQGRHLVAVAMAGEAAVRIGNLDSGNTLGQYPLPSGPVQLRFAKDGTRLFVLSSEGTLSVIDPRQRLAAAPNLFCREPR